MRRAALDIGSGMTKFQVADVDVAKKTIIKTVVAREYAVPFAIVQSWSKAGR